MFKWFGRGPKAEFRTKVSNDGTITVYLYPFSDVWGIKRAIMSEKIIVSEPFDEPRTNKQIRDVKLRLAKKFKRVNVLREIAKEHDKKWTSVEKISKVFL